MMDLRNCKPIAPRVAKNGRAPSPEGHGDYACESQDCGCTFAGGKRAVQCADCAYGYRFVGGAYTMSGTPDETRKMVRESGISKVRLTKVSTPTTGSGERYFVDTLSVTGDHYLIPAARRMEWDIFDTIAEEMSAVPPIPEWAKPLGSLSHIEFGLPKDVFA